MRIAVLGMGSMGSWLASEMAGHGPLAVYDRDPNRTAAVPEAVRMEAPAELAGFQPELLVNAVGIGDTIDVFRSVETFLPPGCILADMATIKRPVFDYYEKCPFPHASIHPLFGPRFADLKRVSGRIVLLLRDSAEPAKMLFRTIFSNLRCRVLECSLPEHEAVMGTSLALPLASSIAFAAALSTDPLPGSSFTALREFAGRMFQEDDRLLAEILFNPHSLRKLDDMTRSLEFLKHVIRARDYEEAFHLLDRLREKIGPALDSPAEIR
ncbi:MAG: prephenate dehydrogenase [Candidatus Aminicenantes bacterium]|nr:prephenate dehydrogenase [Candidatus Aminicenantes bacterium]